MNSYLINYTGLNYNKFNRISMYRNNLKNMSDLKLWKK